MIIIAESGCSVVNSRGHLGNAGLNGTDESRLEGRNMPKRSNAFQTLIYQIQSHFAGNADFIVTESEGLIHSITSEKREVDIVVKTRINDVPVLLCFECTSQNRIVGSPWVESMLGKHKYLPTDKLVLVSESGFSKPALRLAEESGSALAISLSEVDATDWTRFAQKYNSLHSAGFIAKLIDVTVIPVESDASINLKIDKEKVVFRRISDGVELGPLDLGEDIMKNPEVGRLLISLWMQEKKDNGKTEFEITVNWKPKKTYLLRVRRVESLKLTA